MSVEEVKSGEKFYLWDYDRGEVTQYLRLGECNGCGDCCRGKVKFSVVDLYEPDYPKHGGMATSGEGLWAEARWNGKRVFYRMRGYEDHAYGCNWLDENGRCSSYETRFFLCEVWPLSPHDIVSFPNCSYSFKELGCWKFDEITGMWEDEFS